LPGRRRTVSIPVGFFQALQPRRRSGSPSRIQMCFNPCRVFSGLATPPPRTAPRPPQGFNPCRVFSGLATPGGWPPASSGAWFQSLSGFFRPCNRAGFRRVAPTVTLFQSLSGFFRPCNGRIMESAKSFTVFQSLSGFFRPCNSELPVGPRSRRRVSIPVGFFQALQRPNPGGPGEERSRFNPCRVFSGLATQ